ncbi:MULTISPECIES: ATP-binding cassette domain-containing protein [unclassified Acinetobacter]|uniref:ATP-binding cassette domain-containing protein n=1 Tax=unclassified Acinetobacter TaxID=196816 RepID=UPI0035BA2702
MPFINFFCYSIESRFDINDIYYLNQRVDIFDISLEENVALNSKCDLAKIKQSLNLSGFSDSEIDTLRERNLGEQGANISGGQAQRIGIARMIYHDAKVIILDEPTAGLDKVAVQTFIHSIKEAAKNRTCIIITHDSRLKAISDNTILLE